MRKPSTAAVVRSLYRTVIAVALAAAAGGCAALPRIDPTGEQILTWTQPPAPVLATPGVVAPAVAAPGLTLTPQRIVAPVGSEVLLVAGVHGLGQPNLTGERVEWMLSPGSVGHFLAVGESERLRFLRFSTPPQKVSNDYAVSETQFNARIITHGTVNPADDVTVMPGQAWVTIASPVEGSSHVTAFAPDVQGVISNRQAGVIHWVDARWNAPASATVSAGELHTLTTTVTRVSNGAPLAGYKVRYEVAGGQEAGFGPALSGGVELTTNDQGTASAELAPREATAGATQVSVQLIRPAGAAIGANEPLVLGNTTVTISWATPSPGPQTVPQTTAPPVTAPPSTVPPVGASQTPAEAGGAASAQAGIEVKVISPTEPVATGGQAAFEIRVRNLTTQALQNVVVLDRFDSGLRHSVANSPIKRTENRIAAGEELVIPLLFTVVAPGRHCHQVEVTADGGWKASGEGCVTAVGEAARAPAASPIAITKTGPEQLAAGQQGLVKIEIRNVGKEPIQALQIVETFDDALIPLQATQGNQRTGENEITWQYKAPLAAGGAVVFEVQYQAKNASPQACTRATASAGGNSATAEHCVQINGAPAANAPAGLTITFSDLPQQATVGMPLNFRITVRNQGILPQANVTLTVELPDALTVRSVKAQVKQAQVGRTLRFEPVLSLRPQEPVFFDIVMTPTRAGRATLRASVTREGLATPIEAEQAIQIDAGG